MIKWQKSSSRKAQSEVENQPRTQIMIKRFNESTRKVSKKFPNISSSYVGDLYPSISQEGLQGASPKVEFPHYAQVEIHYPKIHSLKLPSSIPF